MCIGCDHSCNPLQYVAIKHLCTFSTEVFKHFTLDQLPSTIKPSPDSAPPATVNQRAQRHRGNLSAVDPLTPARLHHRFSLGLEMCGAGFCEMLIFCVELWTIVERGMWMYVAPNTTCEHNGNGCRANVAQKLSTLHTSLWT